LYATHVVAVEVAMTIELRLRDRAGSVRIARTRKATETATSLFIMGSEISD
jgi:hypothetical protein